MIAKRSLFAVPALLAGLFVFPLLSRPVAAQEAPATQPATQAPRPREEADKPHIKLDRNGSSASFLAAHERFLKRGQEPAQVLFLGDSITAGWGNRGKETWKKRYEPLQAANFGIGGDKTQNVIWRIDNGELDQIRPKVVVLMIGTNNASAWAPEETAAGVTTIVEKIKQKLPESKILLLGIFPRGEKPDDARRQKNIQVNEIISKLDDGKTVRYLDIGKTFLQPDGTLSKEIMYDFLHLTEKGYEMWADAIQPLLDEMLKA